MGGKHFYGSGCRPCALLDVAKRLVYFFEMFLCDRVLAAFLCLRHQCFLLPGGCTPPCISLYGRRSRADFFGFCVPRSFLRHGYSGWEVFVSLIGTALLSETPTGCRSHTVLILVCTCYHSCNLGSTCCKLGVARIYSDLTVRVGALCFFGRGKAAGFRFRDVSM